MSKMAEHSGVIARADVAEYVRGFLDTAAATRVLNPEALEGRTREREAIQTHVESVLRSFGPYLPSLPETLLFEAHIVDKVDVAQTIAVDDGGQLILLGRHFIAFLRSLIETLVEGLKIDPDGEIRVRFEVTDAERSLFGTMIGEYLELRATLPKKARRSELGSQLMEAAVEFLIAHEIVHAIEAHSRSLDGGLTGFQDFFRLRAHEYQCDKKAAALVLLRRNESSVPEVGLAGCVVGMLAVMLIDELVPGPREGTESFFHPSPESRTLRLYFQGELVWRAANMKCVPRDLSGLILRRLILLQVGLENDARLLASPINMAVHQCAAKSQIDHESFAKCCGELFARGRVDQVATALGVLWGDALAYMSHLKGSMEVDSIEERAAHLLEELWRKLKKGTGTMFVAELMAQARDHPREPDTVPSDRSG